MSRSFGSRGAPIPMVRNQPPERSSGIRLTARRRWYCTGDRGNNGSNSNDMVGRTRVLFAAATCKDAIDIL